MKRNTILWVAIVGILLLGGCSTQKQIENQISSYLSDYNSGSISYDEAYSQISSCYEDANNEEKTSFIDGQLEELDKLKESKELRFC